MREELLLGALLIQPGRDDEHGDRIDSLSTDGFTAEVTSDLEVRHGASFYAPSVQRTSVSASCGYSRMTGYAARVIPWIVLAVVVVPLVIAGFVATRRSTVAREHPVSEDAKARARTEQEFAEAEAYEAKWREEDKERFHQERLP